jgi:preprotein translocase subunit SecE
MNSKASSVASGTSATDILKYVAAAVVAGAGIAAFYLLPAWPAPVRALIVVAGFAGALFVASLTGPGYRGRDFVSEALFELRKVVWPTRQEAGRITIVVLVVVLAISLILAGFDFLIAQAVKLLLSN